MGCSKIISLTELTNLLDSFSAARWKEESLGSISQLQTQTVDLEDLLPFVFFREDTYGRTLVHRRRSYEILVNSWLPNQKTPIHDHNGQRCWMWVSSGKLTFRNYHRVDSKQEAPRLAGPDQVFSAGESTYIDDTIGLHEIVNLSGKPAISLHLYAKPISKCQVFNAEKEKFEWQELACFNLPEVADDLDPQEHEER
jgi:cysteine dioxygenase